ncbi:MAG: F0F1 ATP synthase subunit B' [Beijerinckiaceae bacterium]|jgi:F-type H+-transporting ATPase subunit b
MATTEHEGTEVPGAPHEASFPPFDPATFSSTLVWLALTFALLYVVMSKVGLPRVASILKHRADQIRSDLAAAFKSREEANQASAAYDKTLAEAKASSQALAQETRARVKHEQDAKRVVIEAELNAKLQAAEAQIAERKASAMASVGEIAGEAAAAIVAHITGKSADPAAIAAAIAQAKV